MTPHFPPSASLTAPQREGSPAVDVCLWMHDGPSLPVGKMRVGRSGGGGWSGPGVGGFAGEREECERQLYGVSEVRIYVFIYFFIALLTSLRFSYVHFIYLSVFIHARACLYTRVYLPIDGSGEIHNTCILVSLFVALPTWSSYLVYIFPNFHKHPNNLTSQFPFTHLSQYIIDQRNGIQTRRHVV